MSDTTQLSTSSSTEPAPRYRLNRAGIHNVWQYDDQVFHFADGRLLLRGRNGAGKTKALEMLLPFLLDGDARRLDTGGTGRTSLRWLLFDGRRTEPDAAADTVQGYVWVEFARQDDNGDRQWLTLGAAIAATQGEEDARTLFYVTDRRMGTELQLVADGRPLASDKLRAEVGENNCYATAATYRARVMSELFGLDDPLRYRNLIHLLYRLRRPTIGERIEAGELTSVLAEALPPTDETVLDTVGRNLTDLEAARAQLSALRTARDHVEEFLGDYRRYLHGALRSRAEAVREQLDAYDRRADEVETLAAELESLVATESAAQEERDRVRRTRETASADAETLTEIGQLGPPPAGQRERRAVIEANIRAAKSAWVAAGYAHTAEEQTLDQLAAQVSELIAALDAARETRSALGEACHNAGVDPAACGQIPYPDAVTLTPRESTTHVDLEGLEHAVDRAPVAGVDAPTLHARLAEVHTALTRTRQLLEDRQSRAQAHHDHLVELDAARRRADALRDEAESTDRELDSARSREREAAESARRASTRYAEAVRRWGERLRGSAPEQSVALTALEDQVHQRAESAALDPDDSTAGRVCEMLTPFLDELRDQRDITVGEERELAAELDDLAERRTADGDGAKLDRRIAIAEALLAEARERRTGQERQAAALAADLRDPPDKAELAGATAVAQQRRKDVAAAARDAAAAASAAENAREALLRIQDRVDSATAEHDLPADPDKLAETRSALHRAGTHLDTLIRDLGAVTARLDGYAKAVADWEERRAQRIAAEDARTQAIQSMITVRRQIELTDRAGAALPEQVVTARGQVGQRRDDAAARLPELERSAQRARDERVAAEARYEMALRERTEQARRALRAGTRLRAPLLAQDQTESRPDPRLLAAAGLEDAADLDRLLSVSGSEAEFRDASGDALATLVQDLAALTAAVEARLDSGSTLDDSAILRRHDDLHRQLDQAGAAGRSELTEPAGVKRVAIHDDSGSHDITEYATRLSEAITQAEQTAALREEEAYERHLLGELAGHLGQQISEARALIATMNDVLSDVTTSQGLGVRLDWCLAPDADEDISAVVPLLERPAEQRTRLETTRLRDALRRCIEAIRRLDPGATQGVQLRAALDYRSWFEFTVYVTDAQRSGRERRLSHRTGLSQGEQRVVAYLALFAAAAAQFAALGRRAPHAPRLILLDDAFAKVDEPTHGRLLGLLAQLDLDFVLTSERLWGCFPDVPSLQIYECLRDPAVPGIATVHFTWDGHRRRIEGD